jgi:hypothetical protein
VKESALKTLGGAILHSLEWYNQLEQSGNDWEKLCGWLELDVNEPYCIEYEKKRGFILTTRTIVFRYVHHDFGERKIEVKRTNSLNKF